MIFVYRNQFVDTKDIRLKGSVIKLTWLDLT